MRDSFANSVVQESNEVNAKQDYQKIRYSLNIDDDLDAVIDDELDAPFGSLRIINVLKSSKGQNAL